MKDFKMINKTLRKGMLTTVAAGGLLLAASAAQAAPVFFAPGTPDVGATDHTPLGIAAADKATPTRADIFNWQARNNALNTGPGAPNAHRTWNINILDDNSFSETFTFFLQSTTNSAAGTAAGYGNAGGFFDTFVTMIVSASGTVNDHTASTENLVLNYDTATFDWYFHPDGVAEDCSIPLACSAFASFAGTGTGTPEVAANPDRWELEWSAEITSLTGNQLTDLNGDPLDDPETDIEFKITNQTIQLQSDTGVVGGSRTLVVGLLDAGTTVFTSVSEPGTLALFGIGLLSVGLAARRRRKAAA